MQEQKQIKAGLVKNVVEYQYSSYNDYIDEVSGLVDIDFVLSMMSKNEFVRLNEQPTNATCIDIDESSKRLNDDDTKIIMREISKCKSATEFQALPIISRDRYIAALKEKGLSIRQISRITGVSFGIVRRLQ